MIYSILTILILIPIFLTYRIIVFLINIITLFIKMITSIIGNIILPFFIIYEANRFNKVIGKNEDTFKSKFRFSDINMEINIDKDEMMDIKDILYFMTKNEKIKFIIKRFLFK